VDRSGERGQVQPLGEVGGEVLLGALGEIAVCP